MTPVALSAPEVPKSNIRAAMTQATLNVHKAGIDYIGQLVVEEAMPQAGNVDPPQMALIIDNSGSMGQWSKRMLNLVFPEMLGLMGFTPDDTILLILFSCHATHYHVCVKDLPSFQPPRQGSTQMRGVYDQLQAQLLSANPRVQVLALSDGAVSDQQQTAEIAARVSIQLRSNFQIEARAVRLFTSSYGQPDTRALASVLQLNTGSAATLVDLGQHVPLPDMARTMADMFDCTTGQGFTLRTGEAHLQSEPWSEPKSELRLRLGRNTFWLKGRPQEATLNGYPVEIHLEEQLLNQDSMNDILKDKLDFFVSHLKVLKVIDTEHARSQIARIVSYFKTLEASLAPPQDIAHLLEGGSLKNRVVFLKKTLQRRLRSATTMMESIANDDRVRVLNQAQQADYLRQTAISKNSKALAKRAAAGGMDFDETLRAEVLRMKAHLDELDVVDGRTHAVSFYSQASTLDGIREVCALADDRESFEELTAVDILQVFNIVGVPAVGPISDYPDPMTYRVDELLPGSYISVADLSIADLAGGSVKAPGTEVKIDNAIPVFEDIRVQRFLQTYAPSAVEYICSIGMRRVLAEVPQTFAYTVCAAVWNLIQRLDTQKTELNVTLLQRMAPAYHESLQGRFDYLMPMLQTNQDESKSYFLSHNGITNMISPIWQLASQSKIEHMPRILRALYSFETFQAMRRLCRQHDAKHNIAMLDDLLGVDLKAHGTKLPEMFSRTEPHHCQTPYLNRDLFDKLCAEKPVAKAKYAALMLPFFSAVRQEDPVAQMRAIPELTEEEVVKALSLDYPFQDFLLYNIVEGLLYQSKQSRIDKETDKPLRPDLGTRSEGVDMVRAYLRERYSQDYGLRMKELVEQEKKQLCKELIGKLLCAYTLEDFTTLLTNGIARGPVTFKIDNCLSYGCLELHDALMQTDHDVPLRVEKLKVFYTGEDSTQAAVWNGGNNYRTNFAPLQQLMSSLGAEATFEFIVERAKEKRSHVYRGGQCACNRHGHSNDFPSYFAFGHDSLLPFAENSSKETWEAYQRDHANCCGVCSVLYLAERQLAKRANRADSANKSIQEERLSSLVADLRAAGA